MKKKLSILSLVFILVTTLAVGTVFAAEEEFEGKCIEADKGEKTFVLEHEGTKKELKMESKKDFIIQVRVNRVLKCSYDPETNIASKCITTKAAPGC
jgi:hypothetical protein